MNFLHTLTDPAALLHGFGGWTLGGLALVIFIESGVLFPFLPGDSLLVTAAMLREQLDIAAWQIITVGIIAAFLGDQVGYFLGRRFGRSLFKPNARVLKTKYLEEAEEFFAKHGPLALILGRFVPIVRTYVPLAAGTAAMRYPRFLAMNIIGAVSWVCSMTFVGVALGHIPGIAHSIDLIMIAVIFISLLPIIISAVMKRRKNSKAKAEARVPVESTVA